MLASLAPAVLALAPTLAPAAQAGAPPEAWFNGRVVKDTVPSLCQEGTHRLDCHGLRLASSTFDLTALEGQLLRFGVVQRGVLCDVYEVVEVGVATATLEWCGTPSPGCPVRLRVGPTGVIGAWSLWAAAGPAFFPLDEVTGSVLVQPPALFLGSGLTFGEEAYFEASVPDDPALVGAPLWFQGTRHDIGPVGPLELTNVECFTILPAKLPCLLPDC